MLYSKTTHFLLGENHLFLLSLLIFELKNLSSQSDGSESLNEEIVKNLMDLRAYLEKRIQELDEETERLNALFKIVDEVIVSKSFRTAGTIPVVKSQPALVKSEGVPLKTTSGILLANMYTDNANVKIIPAEDQSFQVTTPPFQTFLISRVLESMKTRDVEAMQRGEITPEEILTYEVLKEGDNIKEILIQNCNDEKRLREIRTSTRWTFEKMYEKTHQQT